MIQRPPNTKLTKPLLPYTQRFRSLPRGKGFEFVEKVVGGSVPRQYIGAVEHGTKEYLSRGPLGFPVVDVSVTLYDGQQHSVDSSDQAFKTVARMAMSEGMPN